MLTRKSALALDVVLDIARHARPEPVSTRDIAKRQKIARRTLEHVMQPLVKAGILCGQRGPKGGYWLGRERRRITAGEILRAAGGGRRAAGGGRLCAKTALIHYLDQITLEAMDREIRRQEPERAKPGGGGEVEGFNFTI